MKRRRRRMTKWRKSKLNSSLKQLKAERIVSGTRSSISLSALPSCPGAKTKNYRLKFRLSNQYPVDCDLDYSLSGGKWPLRMYTEPRQLGKREGGGDRPTYG